MKTPFVTVSSKYQIVLPEEVRNALSIKPGQQIAVMREGRNITLIPVQQLKELIGTMPAHDWTASDLRDREDHSS